MQTSWQIPFSGNPLDRASDRRTDPKWVAARLRDPGSLVWPFCSLKPLLRNTSGGSAQACYLPKESAKMLAGIDALTIFLGLRHGNAVFAQCTNGDMPSDLLSSGEYFCEARAAAQLLPLADAAILGQAKAVLDWHRRHGFCPNCGERTAVMDGGYRRHCPSCGADHFPRTDPVVIMLALHDDACLVGRSPRFAEGMFSALAGFIEPGETIEEAVAREIFEEAGVRVTDVSYFAAQPWPFPSSLMIGCFAQAQSRALTIDTKELAEAFWLPKSELRSLLSGEPVRNLRVPSSVAIAHHLLRRFAEMPDSGRSQ